MTEVPVHRIYLMGAPGAGVSTLGRALAQRLGYSFFDTDDYYWFTSDPMPYRRKRNPDHRRALLRADLDRTERYVLAGSLSGWGELFSDRFDMVIYRWLPVELRLSRIRQRETERYGVALLQPGGELHTVFQKFLTWAAEYDARTTGARGRQAELEWLATCLCPTLRLESDEPVEQLVERVLEAMLKNKNAASPG